MFNLIGFEEATDLLIKNGADVNTVDNGGFTSLHWSAHNGNFVNLVEVLELKFMKHFSFRQCERSRSVDRKWSQH